MKNRLLLLLFPLISFAQNTILWKVEKPGSDHISYLLGTFHQMGNSFIDGKPQIKEALNKSDIAIFESIEDRNEKIINVMLNREEDFSYRKSLNKQDVDFLENYTKDWEIPLSKQKPGELILKLQQEYVKENCKTIEPTDTSEHMDDYLLSLAKKQNIETLGLENYSDQFDAINIVNGEEFTWDKAQNAVHFWIENFQKNKDKNKICAPAKEYIRMKFDYQFKVKCAENDGMLSNRNEKWMTKIIKNIAVKNSFIAVGLMHLYGECGIVSQLRSQGYTVTPVKFK